MIVHNKDKIQYVMGKDGDNTSNSSLSCRILQPTKARAILFVVVFIQAILILIYKPLCISPVQWKSQSRLTELITTQATNTTQSHITAQLVKAKTPTNDYEDRGELEDKLFHGKHTRRRLPDFIVAGVKKCGTRALLNFLNIHPDIVTTGREVHFFDVNDTYSRGLEAYRKMMPYSFQYQLTGEKSPGYYRYFYVPERIYKMNSTIKLIFVIREPIERAMSNYLQHQENNELEETFEDSVINEDGDVKATSPHIYNSDYNLFIDNWFRWFNRSQMMFVNGNELIKTPYIVMEKLQLFLGVQPFVTKDHFIFDEEKGFYCYYNTSKSRHSCLGDSKGRPHPAINPKVEEKLKEYFRPRNEEFFRKIGIKSFW